ncbi:asparagine synthase (glutamine-hydrolyzing) [Streptomyces mirabilis]|uniref:asparagine synthase (glutamine-hydrolyzing) n=1 Tax=Streptomyces mirabilis TaxID=68239 RepID=UPI00365C9497
MCGIAGWVSFDRDLRIQRAVVESMTRTMSLRGPDGSGIWIEGHAALGHHRLAVIDPPGGAQPMAVCTSRGPVVLTYSGEAYNFEELRRLLVAKGHRFRTSSDTEVVLRGYLEWGERLAERLNGMYAFALWDSGAGKLVMVRDRLGVKPLYYAPTADGVLFGSEPKAILVNPLMNGALDIGGLRRLIAYTLTLGDPVWAGMREVEPGTVVTVSPEGIRTRRYWKLETRKHTGDWHETVARVRELLDDIVDRQLVADVPRCVLLSGGLDSSALAALATTRLAGHDKRLRTVAVDFVGDAGHFTPDDERPTRDAPYVQVMAEHLGSEHHDVMLDPAALVDPALRERVVRAYDLPPGSGDRDRSLLLLFQAVRDRSTVALSGESADELFGGYAWFHEPAVQKADMFPWITAVFETYGGFADALDPDVEAALDLRSFLADRYAEARGEVDHQEEDSPQERRMRVVSHLHLTRHLRVLLDRKDRLSMAVGLEVRVPYCDHRLVEYVYNAPWALKSFDGREKSLLRAAVRDVLPPLIADRVKSAYPIVRDLRHTAALQEQLRELAATSAHQVFALVSHSWLEHTAREDPRAVTARRRNLMEWVLNLASWLEVYRPALRLG